jgi:hypothetical protein
LRGLESRSANVRSDSLALRPGGNVRAGIWGLFLLRICPSLVAQDRLYRQFCSEAGIRTIAVHEADYDRFLSAAGQWGYSVEVIELDELPV